MTLLSFLRKNEPLISIDIGSTSIKCLEFDIRSKNPKLLNIAMAPIGADVFAGYSISNTQKVADQIKNILDANAISSKRVVTAMPSPGVFSKKITIDKIDSSEIPSYMEMEAQNIVPHSIDAVRMDYHVLGDSENGQMDILVVAVKNEVVDSYLETFELCGLQVAVVDVDYFALQNMYEINYPELTDKTVALINVGARYSSINICRNGSSIFTGDMAVGGKSLTETLIEEAGLPAEDAEKIKRKADLNSPELESVKTIVNNSIDGLASEFNRQLSLFWNASGSEGAIDKIFISGGGAQLTGLPDIIKSKTNVECEMIDPLKNIEHDETFDDEYLKSISPFIGVVVGLGIRQAGDKDK
jgi:type IV pilus assembly protein PilM